MSIFARWRKRREAGMNTAKILKVVKRYDDLLKDSHKALPVERYDSASHVRADDEEKQFAHLRWMIKEIYSFVAEGRVEKAHRWLGFIQGCLWSACISSIDDLKKDNEAE